MTETRVVHRHEGYDEYVGRGGRFFERHMNNTPIGEPGWLGNPYDVRKFGREQAIALFKQDFLKRVSADPAFRNAVLQLRNKRLGCWCAPQPCHGDVIARWIDSQDPTQLHSHPK